MSDWKQTKPGDTVTVWAGRYWREAYYRHPEYEQHTVARTTNTRIVLEDGRQYQKRDGTAWGRGWGTSLVVSEHTHREMRALLNLKSKLIKVAKDCGDASKIEQAMAVLA